jgi:succinyl-CoA synthetase beta subunit
MKLHEFQAKRLFVRYGIPVQRAVLASTPPQAATSYTKLKALCKGGKRFACNVKAQIHAGGRGKAGGVLVAASAQEAKQQAAKILGKRLVTHQTGPEGLPVRRVLLDERVRPTRELYLAITIDRQSGWPVILASRQGGVDIEAVAKDDPSAIHRELVDPAVGVLAFQVRRVGEVLGLAPGFAKQLGQQLPALYRCFIGADASLVEVNPLAETDDGRLLPLDAKVDLDENALHRHPDLAKLRDRSQEHPLESKAGQIGISYVGLDGTIGCLVNGAGLAMATNDIIKLCGGEPANFLDVGGGANVEQVTKAFQVIISDDRVRAILVNIFGGIMRCDWIAQGLLNATRSVKVGVPIVVRLAGTNVEQGRAMLAGTDLPITPVDDLDDAAKQVVALAAA